MGTDHINTIVSETISRSAAANAASAARIAESLAESASGAVRAALLATMLLDAAVKVAAALTRSGKPFSLAHDVMGLRIEQSVQGYAERHVVVAHVLGADRIEVAHAPGLFRAARRRTIHPVELSRAEFEAEVQKFAREATEFLLQLDP
jgi:hypothetical protein